MGIASCQIQHSGSGRYLTSQIAYYTGDRGELEGQWHGKGAEKLGLTDSSIKHNDKRVDKLLAGLDPATGQVLRHGGTTTRIYTDQEGNTKEYRSTTAFDLTLSAPKSVSVLWATSSKEERLQIEGAQQEAVRQTLSYIEDNLCYIRTRDGRERATLTAGTFQHSTSREGDPQLHTHCLLMNFGITESGKKGALHSKAILKSIHEIGCVYENALRGQLHEIGLTTVTKKLQRGTSFEIEGVSEKVCREFSKRRAQIEAEITPQSTTKDIQNIVLSTRQEKEKKIDRNALFEGSKQIAHDLGFNPEQVWSKTREKQPEEQLHKERKLQELHENVTRSLAKTEPFRAIREQDIRAQFLKHSGGTFTLKELEKTAKEYTKQNLHQIGGEINRWNAKSEAKLHLRVKNDKPLLLRKLYDQVKQSFSKEYRERVSKIYAQREELKEKREADHKLKGKNDAPKLYALKQSARMEANRDSLYSIVRSKLIRPLQRILPEGKPLSARYRQKQYEKSRKRYERRAAQFKRRVFFLYIRGKISRSTYLNLRDGKGMPKTVREAQFKWATHQISKKQRNYAIRLLEQREQNQEKRDRIQAQKQTEMKLEQLKKKESQKTILRETPIITIERERERER